MTFKRNFLMLFAHEATCRSASQMHTARSTLPEALFRFVAREQSGWFVDVAADVGGPPDASFGR
jgi:hypothetical protein